MQHLSGGFQSQRCLSCRPAQATILGRRQNTQGTGAKTRARIVYHLYHDSHANDDTIRVIVGGAVRNLELYRCP